MDSSDVGPGFANVVIRSFAPSYFCQCLCTPLDSHSAPSPPLHSSGQLSPWEALLHHGWRLVWKAKYAGLSLGEEKSARLRCICFRLLAHQPPIWSGFCLCIYLTTKMTLALPIAQLPSVTSVSQDRCSGSPSAFRRSRGPSDVRPKEALVIG